MRRFCMIRLAAASFAALALSFVTAAQSEPLPAPLSPDVMAALPAALREDPRAFEGGIAFGEALSFGCESLESSFQLAIIAPPNDEIYVLRYVVRQDSSVFKNVRTIPFLGSPIMTIFASPGESGGSAPAAFPLAPDVPTIISALLIDQQGKPLWFAEVEFDCDGDPVTLTRRSGPVTILNQNPSFDIPGATAKLAQKWSFTGKIKRNCAQLAGDCAAQIGVKPGRETFMKQVRKHKNGGFGAGGFRFGHVISLEKFAVDSMLWLDVTSEYAAGGATGYGAGHLPDISTDVEYVIGLRTQHSGTGAVKRTTVTVTNLDNDEVGTWYVRSIYVWAFHDATAR